MRLKIGIPKSLLYYYYKDLWFHFFKYLDMDIITSSNSTKKTLEIGESIAHDEACLSLKLFLGHVAEIKDQCDFVLIPRLFSIKKKEAVCTNFNCLYDLVNNSFDGINILNYNVDLTSNENEVLGFLKMGKKLGISYIQTYHAYQYAKKRSLEIRKKKEEEQSLTLTSPNLKILLVAHPYNLYDDLVGRPITNFLEKQNITILYSDRINHELIDSLCDKLSSDIHWTHSKELMASIQYYKDKVDGMIILSSFPCGPDSLSTELVIRKVKNIPILNLLMENLNSDVGLLTRLESFIDILSQKKEGFDEENH